MVFVPILSRRFVRNRGMAVAIVQSANGFARAFSAPLSQMLIAGLGWRGAYLAQGGFMAAAFLPLARCSGASEPRAIGGRRSARRRLDAAPGDAHAAFLAAVRWSTCSPGWAASWWRCTSFAFAVTIGFDKLYAAEVLGLGAFLSLPGVIVTGMDVRLHRA